MNGACKRDSISGLTGRNLRGVWIASPPLIALLLAGLVLAGLTLTGLGSAEALSHQVAPASRGNLLHLLIDDPDGQLAGHILAAEIIGQPDWLVASSFAISLGSPPEVLIAFDIAASAETGSGGALHLRLGALDAQGNWGYVTERRVLLTVVSDAPASQQSYEVDECCLPSSGIANGLGRRPAHHILLGATPNPTQSLTSIRFGLPAGSGSVKLIVYDVAGRRVRTLATPPLDGGYHQITWNATDDRGRRVPPGIYFYGLSTGSWSATQQLLLLR